MNIDEEQYITSYQKLSNSVIYLTIKPVRRFTNIPCNVCTSIASKHYISISSELLWLGMHPIGFFVSLLSEGKKMEVER